MPLELNEIAAVARAILDRLSYRDTRWTVTGVGWVEETEPFVLQAIRRRGLEVPRLVFVRAAEVSDASCTINAYFNASTLPTQQAIAQLADSLQDDVIEYARAAVPVCPGHSHPLSVRLVDGLAVWACPLNTRPAEPIWNASPWPESVPDKRF